MYYFLYQTTCLINGKHYSGKHQTNDLNDGYLGSGIALKRAIKKYGIENFERRILMFCSTVTELNMFEQQLITEDVINDPNSYNIALGGQGGNLGEKVNQKISSKCKGKLRGPMSENHKQAISKAVSGIKKTDQFKDKLRDYWVSMSDEKREQYSQKMSELSSGNKNGFYGKTHSVEFIEEQRDRARQQMLNYPVNKRPGMKPVTVNGVTYFSRRECMKQLNITYRELIKLIGEKLC